MKRKINLLWILPAFTLLLAFTTLISDSGFEQKIIIEINSDDDYDKHPAPQAASKINMVDVETGFSNICGNSFGSVDQA